MNVEIVTQEKNNLEIKLDNLTVAELLRVYLNERGIEFAAWRREHPTKPVILKVQSTGKTVKKEISDAITIITKDLDALATLMKKK